MIMKRIICYILAMLCLAGVLGGFASCDNAGADKNDGADIFEIKYNGETLELGAKADAALSKLGAPVSKQNTGNCGGLGETTRYDYSAFWLVVVDYENGDKTIDRIEFKNDAVETSKGIYIGSSESSVKEAYGEADSTVKSTLIYKGKNKELAIGITDGAVSSIVFRCVEADS